MSFKQIIFKVLSLMFPVFFWIFTTSLNVWSVDIWTVTLQVNWESRSPSVSITGWEFSSINNLLKLRLLDDLTSALDVSCLIMSNKQLVRFVAWIEMWVNSRSCVCPPRHFNKARFVGPGSLKFNCEKWTHWNWAERSHNYLTGVPALFTALSDLVSWHCSVGSKRDWL